MLIGVLYVLATVKLFAMVDQTMVRRIEGWIEGGARPVFDTFEEGSRRRTLKSEELSG